jgi:peptidoglycan/LPS O-acetylase OafA/YrhL
VLVFHAGLPGTGGGFVGVDVFFVLSGFLITGLLLRERESTGQTDLRAFYARRARRILPAAAVVLVGTLGLSWVVLAPLDLPRVAADAVAVALSAGNIRFAAEATDYFAAELAPSPLLHYWSLGVEEQFYLCWPALLILVARGRRPRLAAGVAMVAVIAVSYAACLYLTDVAAPWAFYSLPTRAWQLALGGLLAVPGAGLARLPGSLATPIGWLGLLAVLAALVLIDPTTPYPGLAALLPTLGAGALILAGTRRWAPGRLLAMAPMRFLGRISYSLYLVHWPFLVLPAASLAIGEQLPLELRVVLALDSIAAAWAVHRLVERPFHRSRVLAIRPGRTLALAGAAMAATVVISAGVGATAARLLDGEWPLPWTASGRATDPGPDGKEIVAEPSGPAAPVPSDLPESPEPSATASPAPDPSGSPGPTASATPAPQSPTPTSTPAPTQPAGAVPLPADVRPALSRAASDREPLDRDGCSAGYLATRPPDCVYGDRGGGTTLALVGDSHASQWFPALERIAVDEGWRLVPFIKVSCRFVDLPMVARELKREYTECPIWREHVITRLQELRPALVVVASARGMQPLLARDDDPRRQGEAMARLLARIPGRIAILVDTPQSRYDVPRCLSAHVRDVRACETSRSYAFNWRHRLLEETAAAASGAALIDLSDRICSRDPCPVLDERTIVYRDPHHMTATFARSLAGTLRKALPRP